MRFSRITVDPRQMGGVPCIRHLRIPVATVVGMVADGMTREEIVEAYPDLKPKDIDEALRYAAEAVRERALPLRSPSDTSKQERLLPGRACAGRRLISGLTPRSASIRNAPLFVPKHFRDGLLFFDTEQGLCGMNRMNKRVSRV